MQNVTVTNYTFGEDINEATILEFIVYKKGLFGGIKPDRKFNGWCLMFSQLNQHEIDIDSLYLQDGNIHGQPLIPQLAYAVLLAGADTLKRSGEVEKASLLQKASIKFFKKYILKKA
ncbi:hypothetical protein KJ656_08040 [bacterium]|nr:hypothetical protein [bacterium]